MAKREGQAEVSFAISVYRLRNVAYFVSHYKTNPSGFLHLGCYHVNYINVSKVETKSLVYSLKTLLILNAGSVYQNN